jgi:hypothetical protein
MHTSQMLAHQSRLGPLGTDVIDAKGLPGNQTQRQSRPQNLPAAFAVRAV